MKKYFFIALFILSIFNFAFSQKITHKVLIDNLLGNDNYGFSLIYDDKGRIYIAGDGGDEKKVIFFVMRFDNQLNVDKSFGDDGKVFLDFSAKSINLSSFNSIVVDKDKIYVVGNIVNIKGDYDIFITRLNEDGSIDRNFGNYGKVILDNIGGGNWDDFVRSFSIKGGKLYLAGTTWKQGNTDGFVIRLDELGNIDESFGNKGIVLLDSIAGGKWDDQIWDLYVDYNRNLFVVGGSYNDRDDKGGTRNAFIMKLKQDGNVDKNFGNNGKVVFSSLSNYGSIAYTIFLDQKSNIYIGGDFWNGNREKSWYNAFIVKIKNDGSFDKSFGNQGIVLLEKIAGGLGDTLLRKIFVDKEGKVFALGSSYNGNNSDIYLLKLNDDGTIDKNFGKDGKIIINKISDYDEDVGLSFVFDKNDNIIITGWTGNDNQKYPFLIKIQK